MTVQGAKKDAIWKKDTAQNLMNAFVLLDGEENFVMSAFPTLNVLIMEPALKIMTVFALMNLIPILIAKSRTTFTEGLDTI